MRHTMMLVLAISLIGLAGRPAAADDVKQKAETFDKTVHVTLKYWLYRPADFDKQEKWPLVIFLHGAGERGDDLEVVKKHGPPKLVEAGMQFPAVIVSPQCSRDKWWHSQLIELSALVDDVVANNKIDKDRIYLTGLSMGGFGTWALAGYTPDRFAAIVPICGGGESIGMRRLTKMPIWVFHGAKDNVVPLKRSEELVEALKQGGSQVKFTVYPDAGHDSWTAAYNDPELWKWLFEQKRAAATN